MTRTALRLAGTALAVSMLALSATPSAAQDTAGGTEDRPAFAIDAKALRAARADRGDADRMIAEAERRGRLPVIVQFDASFAPEGNIGASAALQQRAGFRGRTEGLMSRLGVGRGGDGRFSRGADVERVKTFDTVPLVAMQVGPGALRKLLADDEVAMVFEDAREAPGLAQSVPLIEANKAWNQGFTGAGWTIAVLDSGVNKNHPFLVGKVVSEGCYSTTSASTTSVCPGGVAETTAPNSGLNCSSSLTGCDHGTHVAGIAAGRGGGSSGVTYSGVARDANLIAMQVFSRSGINITAFVSDQIKALERVFALRTTYNIAAVNMSLGGSRWTAPCASDPRTTIIGNLRSAGIATVVSSGNNGYVDAVSAPGCVANAITVGSSTKTNVVSSFSNMDDQVDVMAPGTSITSSTYTTYGVKSGTSMAAPHVAGAFAVLREIAPTATVTQIETALETTGLPISDTRTGGTHTKPRIDLQAAGAQFTTLLRE